MAQEYDSIGGGATGAVSGAASGAMAGAALGPIGMIGGALLGGIFGSKKTRVPKPPTYAQTLKNAVRGQREIMPEFIAGEREFRPEWQKLNETTYRQQMYGDENSLGYLRLMDEARRAMLPYQEQAVRDELAMTGRLIPEARDMLMSDAQKEMQGSLMSDAMTRLSAGTSLTGADERQAQQDARQAMAARGLGGRQAVAFEVLKNNALGIARRDSALQAAYNAMTTEAAFQNQAIEAAGMGRNFMSDTSKIVSSSDMLGNAEGKVFNPMDSLNVQTQGNQYQHGMAMARSNLAQQQGLLNSLGAFGKFSAANPSMFNFSNPFSLGTPTQPPSASVPLGTNSGYYDYGLTNSFYGNSLTYDPSGRGTGW